MKRKRDNPPELKYPWLFDNLTPAKLNRLRRQIRSLATDDKLWELLDNACLFEMQRQGAMKAVAKRLRPLWKENAK